MADPRRIRHASCTTPAEQAEVESELADVLQYLIRLADVLDVDLAAAVRKKIQVNEKRFPPTYGSV